MPAVCRDCKVEFTRWIGKCLIGVRISMSQMLVASDAGLMLS